MRELRLEAPLTEPQRAAARDFQHFFLDGWQDHKPAGTGPYPIAPLVACETDSTGTETDHQDVLAAGENEDGEAARAALRRRLDAARCFVVPAFSVEVAGDGSGAASFDADAVTGLFTAAGRRRFDCAEHPGFTRSRHVVFRNTLRMSSAPGASEARVVDGVDHRARGLPLYRRCECLCAHRTHAYTKSKQSRYVIDCSRYIASQDSEDTCRLKVQRCTAMDWILIPAYCSAIP